MMCNSKNLVVAILLILPFSAASYGQTPQQPSDDAPVPSISKPYTLKTVTPEGTQTPTQPRLSLPVLPGDARPWTTTTINNNPQNFQFAIVTDRTGGMRPGIFEDAVKKLNLLQPEFVMSIGDLITGYTAESNTLNAMWDEFESLVARLQMPFFYVPGNHDMSNPVQKKEWHRRFGPNYYHFKYGDVLFLCLDTEDAGHGALSQEQIDYFSKVINDNQDVRWTLVFMHRPIWIKEYLEMLSEDIPADLKVLEKNRWFDFEQLLKDRHYTVYSGHLHSYSRYIRHDKKYYTLATTGGGSAMKGHLNFGQFDEVIWITMTDNGPVMANLQLDGILPEDLRTNDISSMVYRLKTDAVTAKVTVTDPLPFTSATVHVQVQNQAPLPVTLEFTPPGDLKFDPPTTTVTVPPVSPGVIKFTLDGSDITSEKQLDGLVMNWTATYNLEDKPDIVYDGKTALDFDPRRPVQPAVSGTAIDGNFIEWEGLWSTPQRFQDVVGNRRAWSGMEDASFKVASQHDDENVYLALQIQDDHIITGDLERSNQADFVDIFIAPDGVSTFKSDRLSRLRAAPAENTTTGTVQPLNDAPLKAACIKIEGGYLVELSVPAEKLAVKTGQPWERFRLNVRINDYDTLKYKKSKLWWNPHWDSSKSYPESGTFLRQD